MAWTTPGTRHRRRCRPLCVEPLEDRSLLSVSASFGPEPGPRMPAGDPMRAPLASPAGAPRPEVGPGSDAPPGAGPIAVRPDVAPAPFAPAPERPGGGEMSLPP